MDATAIRPVRKIDHLVLPVISLDDARARFSALGFTVAPNGVHPFGTENANIYLPEGPFLEPLAIASREVCWTEARRGNSFVRNDQAYRFRISGEGFSHTVVTTDDAEADYHRYADLGYPDGPVVTFSRVSYDPEGNQSEARFSLAFAMDPRSPDARFFACETQAPPRSAGPLQQHPNGARRVKTIVLSEQNPTDFQYFLQDVVQQRDVDAHSFGMDVEAADATISVLTPEGLRVHYGLDATDQPRGMLHRTFVVGVVDIGATRGWLESHEVAFATKGERVIVPAALGQGCPICFEPLE